MLKCKKHQKLFIFSTLQRGNAVGDEVAQKAASTFIEATNLLLTHPLLGKPLEDIPEYRELLRPFGSGAYTIRYRIDFDKIVIAGIRRE